MKALVLVDIQNCFLPGGSLGVPDGDAVIEVANRISPKFELVVATRDWHPPGHGSFASTHGLRVGDVVDLRGTRQYLWPDHCVQGTEGAEFATGLDTSRFAHIVLKGTDPGIDSYSTFLDNEGKRDTGLADWLREHDVDTIYLMGLATDYCVKFSALDARRLGFEVYVVIDGCRGVDVTPGDSERAVEEMRAAGVKIVKSDELGF